MILGLLETVSGCVTPLGVLPKAFHKLEKITSLKLPLHLTSEKRKLLNCKIAMNHFYTIPNLPTGSRENGIAGFS